MRQVLKQQIEKLVIGHLNEYLRDNDGRWALLGRDARRKSLFETLVSDITALAGYFDRDPNSLPASTYAERQQILALAPLNIIALINTRLLAAEEANKDTAALSKLTSMVYSSETEKKEHDGESTVALKNAKEALEGIKALYVHSQAEIENANVATKKAQKVAKTLLRGHFVKAAEHKKRLDSADARKNDRLAARTPAQIVQAAIRNEPATAQEAIDVLTAAQLVTRAENLSSIPAAAASSEDAAVTKNKRAFKGYLNKILQSRGMLLPNDILEHIISSPALLEKYQAIAGKIEPDADEDYQIQLVNFLENIAKVIGYLVHIKDGELADLHNVADLKDEAIFLGLLQDLKDRRLISIDEKATKVPALRENGHGFDSERVQSALVSAGQPIRGGMDMGRLSLAMTAVKDCAAAAKFDLSVEPPKGDVRRQQKAALEDLKQQVRETAEAIDVRVKKLDHLSVAIQELNTEFQALSGLVREARSNGDHNAIILHAPKIEPFFALINEMKAAFRDETVLLKSDFATLDGLRDQVHAAQLGQDSLELLSALYDLSEDYKHWNTTYQLVDADEQKHIDDLTALCGEEAVSHDIATRGRTTVRGLVTAAEKALEEIAAKDAIVDDVKKVQEQLANRSVAQDMAPVKTAPRVPDAANAQRITAKFAVALANRLAVTGEDISTATQLMVALKKRNLFTQTLQNKLLAQPSLSPLVAFQRFLENAHPALLLTPAQLADAWDNLHGNAQFDSLAALQERLALNEKAVIALLCSVSPQFRDETVVFLSELAQSGEFRNSMNTNPELLTVLIEASKNDLFFISKVLDVYKICPSDLRTDFFDLDNMKIFVQTVKTSVNPNFVSDFVEFLKLVSDKLSERELQFTVLLDNAAKFARAGYAIAPVAKAWLSMPQDTRGTFESYQTGFLADRANVTALDIVRSSQKLASSKTGPIDMTQVRLAGGRHAPLAPETVDRGKVKENHAKAAAAKSHASVDALSSSETGLQRICASVVREMLVSGAFVTCDDANDPQIIVTRSGKVAAGQICFLVCAALDAQRAHVVALTAAQLKASQELTQALSDDGVAKTVDEVVATPALVDGKPTSQEKLRLYVAATNQLAAESVVGLEQVARDAGVAAYPNGMKVVAKTQRLFEVVTPSQSDEENEFVLGHH
jgi:hypothetical protein